MSMDQVHSMMNHPKGKKFTFTLESGRGETYNTPRPVLYAHSTYERSSVLAGRPQRIFVESWNSWEEARAALNEFQKTCPKFMRKLDDYGPKGGSSHIPVDQMVAHLPDDTDY